MSVDAILKEIEALPAEERAELFGKLSDRYGEPDESAELSDEIKAMLDARIAAADANPGVGYTIEEVIAYVKRPRK